MTRLSILAGLAFMFLLMHVNGSLNKYINMKYSYLSVLAIVLLAVLFLFEFVRMYRNENEALRLQAEGEPDPGHAGHHDQDHDHDHDHNHDHNHDHDHDHNHDHNHDQDHARDAFGDHGHSHAPRPRWRRIAGYAVLIFPIATGVLLPVQTLDSSFVKAKGFSFPALEASAGNPGLHQFLKPDTSVFYGKSGYDKVSHKELAEFAGRDIVALTDPDYLRGLEAVYNFPDRFMGRTVSFDGFVYRGEQDDRNHYFVFRFGFIHCVADSGVFGMLVEFPKGTVLSDDEWVHVSGTLDTGLYRPFNETVPVLKAVKWEKIDPPADPYVYRQF